QHDLITTNIAPNSQGQSHSLQIPLPTSIDPQSQSTTSIDLENIPLTVRTLSVPLSPSPVHSELKESQEGSQLSSIETQQASLAAIHTKAKGHNTLGTFVHSPTFGGNQSNQPSTFEQVSNPQDTIDEENDNGNVYSNSSRNENEARERLNPKDGLAHPASASTIVPNQKNQSASPIQSLTLVQGLKTIGVALSEEERKVLLSNEIPAAEIENLSIGVDAGGMGIIHVAEWRGIKVAIKEAMPQVICKE
ncbi:hypothetical protein BGZ94_006082, partial [Podila epigama]